MKFKSFLSPETQTDFAGADATMGSLPQLANFLTNGYWQSTFGGSQTIVPLKWQSNSITVNITGLNATDKVLARDALADWAAVANLKFTEVTNGPADITYSDSGSKIAVTNSSTVGGFFQSGTTVQISTDFAEPGRGPDGVGSYLFQTYIHETGHALGLGHLGPYNSSGAYGKDNIFTNDTWQYSVMSYFNQSNFGGSSNAFVVTPQMADILAIQNLYGASTTPVGNTTYGFNSTAGPIYNFGLYPANDVPAFTIFNTGANNTLDASGFTVNQTINLNPGQWSSIGGEVNNIGIYTTTNIANAVAGSGNDVIIPNGSLTQKGTLTGGSGNDIFSGTQAGLNKYTIANIHAGDAINFTDATLPFTFTLNGSTLNYGNNQITFSNNPGGTFTLSTDTVRGGIDLTLGANLSKTPVSVGDLTTLQKGVQFFTDPAQATTEAALINATPTTESVFTYASKLISPPSGQGGPVSLAQIAMADSALMEGGTIPVGDTTTTNTLTYLATQFLPDQARLAVQLGADRTVYSAEALGLPLAGTDGFKTNFAGLSTADFVSAVSKATGVAPDNITGFVNNWMAWFSGAGAAALPPGFTVKQAAFGVAFGDAIGNALAAAAPDPLPNLMTKFSTTGSNGFNPNTVAGVVANALIDNAEGLYKVGVSLKALPPHVLLQGEFNGGVEQISLTGIPMDHLLATHS